jgi:two-component system NtrC family sensor kinase
MDRVSSSPAAADSSIRWLRILLATSVLAPALVFVAAAALDYRQTLEAATQRVDRTVRIAHEHTLKLFETSEAVLGRIDDLVDARDADALRAAAPALQSRLETIARSLTGVHSAFVIDAEGAVVASGQAAPDARELANGILPLLASLAATDRAVVAGGALGLPASDGLLVVGRRRLIDGRFAGAVCLSLYPTELTNFYVQLASEHADVRLLLYRADGTVIAGDPGDRGSGMAGSGSAWMRMLGAGAPPGVHPVTDGDGRRHLVALRKVGTYPMYLGSALDFRTIEREWVDKTLVTLGFALAAMLALGAASWMALRRTQAERAAVVQWQQEALRRETAEKALRESQRMEAMGQLTGGVAHDFNNLLMVVNGNLQILRKRLGTAAHERQLDAIGDAIQRGVTLTRHLLAFSRRQALQPQVINLRETMPALCELLSHSLRENVRLVCNVAPDTWPVEVDPAELELALINVAVNARDAMPAGGTLSIAARNATVSDLLAMSGGMTGDFVLVSLHDSGAGVPPAILHRVFEPFFTTKAPGKGTGLGLSQVYGFSRQSGGTVTLQSPPGKGTTVTLWLPRTLGTREPVTQRSHSIEPRGSGRILVVEDDPGVSSVLCELLEQLGYSTATAPGAADALELLKAGPPVDLLLTDVVMTGPLNGLELARTVNARHPDVRVIVMTGYAAEIERIAAEGFTILTKPFDATTLSAAIQGKIGTEALARS